MHVTSPYTSIMHLTLQYTRLMHLSSPYTSIMHLTSPYTSRMHLSSPYNSLVHLSYHRIRQCRQHCYTCNGANKHIVVYNLAYIIHQTLALVERIAHLMTA
jgi:hypothetical protein